MEVSGCRCSLLTSTGSMQQQAHLQVQSVLMRLAADVRKWFWMNLEGKSTDPLNRSKSSALPWWLRSSRGPGGHVLQSAPGPGCMDRMLQKGSIELINRCFTPHIPPSVPHTLPPPGPAYSAWTGPPLFSYNCFKVLSSAMIWQMVAITERYTKVVLVE